MNSHWPEDEIFTDALHTGAALELIHHDGPTVDLGIERWFASPDTADESVLAKCVGRVLDVGCGPGRMVLALQERGFVAAGIDVTPKAVEIAVASGAIAWCQSVFHPLPAGQTHWDTVLLVDGNIGISGDPDKLLERTFDLLNAGGQVIVEVSDQDVDTAMPVSLAHQGRTSRPFTWAYVGRAAAERRASAVGFRLDGDWEVAGRHFLSLRRPA